MSEKKSQFIEVETLAESQLIPVFGSAVDRKISKPNLFKQIKDESFSPFIYPTIAILQSADLEVDVDNPTYCRCEETEYRLYKITNAAPGVDDITLTNGNTAEYQIEYRDTGFVTSVAALASTPVVAGTVYYLKEYHAGTGKGGRALVGKSGSTTYDNVLKFAGAGGYFESININAVTDVLGGCRVDGVTDDTSALQNIINTHDVVYLTGDIAITGTITLPQSRFISIVGRSFRKNRILQKTSGIACFYYQRSISTTGSIFNFENVEFTLDTTKAVNSVAVHSYGYSDGQDDNSMRFTSCSFYNFESAIYAKWTGQVHISGCWFQNNTTDINCSRGCSFWYLLKCMSFSDTFVRCVDTAYDAYTNGWDITNCKSITSPSECLVFEGVQSLYIFGGGFDLGSGGTAAILLTKCTDVDIYSSYISSNNSTTRDGVRQSECRRVLIDGCSIVNNNVGVRVLGPGSITYASAATIVNCWFDGQYSSGNDVLLSGNNEGCKIVNNHFAKQLARIGAAYEIYINTAGSDKNICQFNTFSGSSYTIAGGANSIIGNNIFGVQP